MTFHAFLPQPRLINTPEVAVATTFDLELVAALDVSSYKTAALYLRVHDTFSLTGNLRLVAYPIWPFDDAVGVRFQAIPAVLDTAVMDASTPVGSLLTASPVTICAPALRIVAQIGTDLANNAPLDSVTISGGIVLLDD